LLNNIIAISLANRRKKMKYVLTRKVTKEECGLDKDLEEDEVVYKYDGPTYGCISDSGVACSVDGEVPFFELPRDALKVQ
jgi:hypothetical protein